MTPQVRARAVTGAPAAKALVKGLATGLHGSRSRVWRSMLTGSSRQCPPPALNARVETGPLHRADRRDGAGPWNKTDLQRFLAKSTTLSGVEYIVVALITTKGDEHFRTTSATPRPSHRIAKKNFTTRPEGAGEAGEGLEESSGRGAKMTPRTMRPAGGEPIRRPALEVPAVADPALTSHSAGPPRVRPAMILGRSPAAFRRAGNGFAPVPGHGTGAVTRPPAGTQFPPTHENGAGGRTAGPVIRGTT